METKSNLPGAPNELSLYVSESYWSGTSGSALRRYTLRLDGFVSGLGIEKNKEKQFIDNYKRLTPLGRFAYDDDIKGPVVFLSSEASSYVLGQNLLVDGG